MFTSIIVAHIVVSCSLFAFLLVKSAKQTAAIEILSQDRELTQHEEALKPPEVDLNERLAAMQRMRFSSVRGRRGLHE